MGGDPTAAGGYHAITQNSYYRVATNLDLNHTIALRACYFLYMCAQQQHYRSRRVSNSPLVRCLSVLAAILITIVYKQALGEETTMKITSSAFAHNSAIPAKYTCDGRDVSPELIWSDVPANARSLVLIVDDPDAPDPAAPKMTWVHWVLYNLPPTATGLKEGVKPSELPAGTREGLNDWKRTGYGGPCPPAGRHRYFHKLYALDTNLPDLGKATKSNVEQAMKKHVLAEAVLIGTYQH